VYTGSIANATNFYGSVAARSALMQGSKIPGGCQKSQGICILTALSDLETERFVVSADW
jgi:hypothetical protein